MEVCGGGGGIDTPSAIVLLRTTSTAYKGNYTRLILLMRCFPYYTLGIRAVQRPCPFVHSGFGSQRRSVCVRIRECVTCPIQGPPGLSKKEVQSKILWN